jgi:hypothetical protein
MHQFLVYTGGVFPGDTANSASAVVERDAVGDIYVSTVHASSLVTSGSLFLAGTAKTVTGTLDGTQTVVPCNATSGVQTQTLPPAATVSGQVYWLYKSDSGGNLVTVKGNGAELINGANTYTGLTAQFKYVMVWSNGTGWIILGSN